MFIELTQEPELPQHRGGHGRVHVARAGVPPPPAPVGGGGSRTGRTETAPTEFSVPGRWSLPLSPDAAQFPTQPLVHVLETRLYLRSPKVDDPASRGEVELLHEVGGTPTSST
jgi:hypothetical protein